MVPVLKDKTCFIELHQAISKIENREIEYCNFQNSIEIILLKC